MKWSVLVLVTLGWAAWAAPSVHAAGLAPATRAVDPAFSRPRHHSSGEGRDAARAADLYRQGRRALLRGDDRTAIADFTHVLQLDPTYAAAYRGRGVAYDDLKDYGAAAANYAQSLHLDPRSAATYYDLGLLHLERDEYRPAVAAFTSDLRLNPRDADAYTLRGMAHSELKDDAAALADATTALRLHTTTPAQAYFTRGIAQDDMGNHQAALTDFNRAIQLDPTNGAAYNDRAISRQALGDHNGAIADYQQAAKLWKAQGDTANYNKTEANLAAAQIPAFGPVAGSDSTSSSTDFAYIPAGGIGSALLLLALVKFKHRSL